MKLTRTAATLTAGCALAALSVSGAHARESASGMDKEYLSTSIQGDRFEIDGGHLALQKSANPRVRALARRLISDHQHSLSDALKLAKRVGAPRSSSPSPSETWELSILRTRSGREFDIWYTSLEIKDHEQDIDDVKGEIGRGSNRRVIADARKELPTLRRHLKLSRAARAAS
jgi:putative membrane protein